MNNLPRQHGAGFPTGARPNAAASVFKAGPSFEGMSCRNAFVLYLALTCLGIKSTIGFKSTILRHVKSFLYLCAIFIEVLSILCFPFL